MKSFSHYGTNTLLSLGKFGFDLMKPAMKIKVPYQSDQAKATYETSRQKDPANEATDPSLGSVEFNWRFIVSIWMHYLLPLIFCFAHDKFLFVRDN